MDLKQGKKYLTLSDIKQHSIWKFTDIDDLAHPINTPDDIPEDSFDLIIRAKFTTPTGIELIGYIVGVQNIYCISIYAGDEKFFFNRNLPNDYPKTLAKLGKALNCSLSILDFSPLQYTTDIHLECFKNISGEFDLLKVRTNEERLQGRC